MRVVFLQLDYSIEVGELNAGNSEVVWRSKATNGFGRNIRVFFKAWDLLVSLCPTFYCVQTRGRDYRKIASSTFAIIMSRWFDELNTHHLLSVSLAESLLQTESFFFCNWNAMKNIDVCVVKVSFFYLTPLWRVFDFTSLFYVACRIKKKIGFLLYHLIIFILSYNMCMRVHEEQKKSCEEGFDKW